jgi:hypothetical protein
MQVRRASSSSAPAEAKAPCGWAGQVGKAGIAPERTCQWVGSFFLVDNYQNQPILLLVI